LLTEWIDLDGAAPQDREWLTAHAEIDPSSLSLLLDVMPRSRCVHTDAGILVTFVSPQDANANGGQGLGVWMEPERVITVSRGAGSAVSEVAARVDDGSQRGGGVSLLAALTVALVRPLENTLAELSEQVDDLEDEAMDETSTEHLNDVARVRRRVLAIRRRLNGMCEVVSTLTMHPDQFPRTQDAVSLRRAAEYLERLVSVTDATRDRLTLLFDQLSAREQHRINKAMQKLAVVGTVILPLTFFTGLLGINVSGIPDARYVSTKMGQIC
jgi:zinc transporter